MSRWTFPENFMEAKIIVWKFPVIERKHRISAGNVFSGLSKAHFKCPVEHSEKKMIKVNFTICSLVRTLCVFFCSRRKVSEGSQNHKLSVLRKNFLRIFLSRRFFFQNNSKFWAEKLRVFPKITRKVVKIISNGTEEYFHSNSFEASL